jgi:DNA helicase II / ATP-dependent DNA helicase PcrA
VDTDGLLADLNEQQSKAVRATTGPVCILAGAGSGKTTTITRRIAYQVATGAFRSESILAVTFTDRAASEMRTRLSQLGVSGVRARTFHSAALAQLSHLSPDPVGNLLSSKALAMRQIANRLPRPYRFRAAGDLATEIEWAKNRRINPENYLSSLGDHEPPIPPELMQEVFERYEREKSRREVIDFEDLLELTVQLFDQDPAAMERFSGRYKAFTVDEFQDVNLLQFSLLERWLGKRDELCAVGDDYQSIYGFNGASPRYLLDVPNRFPHALVVKLESNYRSTPELLSFANQLVPNLAGSQKVLRATCPNGEEPVIELCIDDETESRFVAERIRELHNAGVPYEEMAILYRTNFRSEEFEAALTTAKVPYQVRDGAFLDRPAARRMIAVLTRGNAERSAEAVRVEASKQGWLTEVPDGLGEQELTRQRDLTRLVHLADEYNGPTVAGFLKDLVDRFRSEGMGRGVNLLTYHRAKGLEFDAVFLVKVNEGELPYRRARSDDAITEELRLFYVGITRAKRYLTISWVVGGRREPSRFLRMLGVHTPRSPERQSTNRDQLTPASQALRSWRSERSRAAGVPAYVILHDRTLEEIARLSPKTKGELAAVDGIGPMRLRGYGDEILQILSTVGTTASDQRESEL